MYIYIYIYIQQSTTPNLGEEIHNWYSRVLLRKYTLAGFGSHCGISKAIASPEQSAKFITLTQPAGGGVRHTDRRLADQDLHRLAGDKHRLPVVRAWHSGRWRARTRPCASARCRAGPRTGNPLGMMADKE